MSDDPRQVVIESVSILVPDRPDLVFPLGTKEAVAALAAQAPVFKEGVLCVRGGGGGCAGGQWWLPPSATVDTHLLCSALPSNAPLLEPIHPRPPPIPSPFPIALVLVVVHSTPTKVGNMPLSYSVYVHYCVLILFAHEQARTTAFASGSE